MDPFTSTALIMGAGSMASGIMGSRSAGKKSSKYQKRAFKHDWNMMNARQKLLQPYMDVGTQALGGQAALLGLNGFDSQQSYIDQMEASPIFQALTDQGENAMLQNAAATGGLRGGNTQAALARFRPQILNQMIQQRFANLGSLGSQGLTAARSVAGDQANVAARQVQGLQNMGNIQASQAMGTANAVSSGINQFGQINMLKGLMGGGLGTGMNTQGMMSGPSGAMIFS